MNEVLRRKSTKYPVKSNPTFAKASAGARRNISLLIICMFALTTFNPSLRCESKKETTTKKRRRQKPPKPVGPNHKPIEGAQANPPVLNREIEKQKDHDKICNILSFASNIFGNFVQLAREPNNQENVGEQVGNMAENVFHIVSEATKAKLIEKPDLETEKLLQYLESDEFRKDLQKIVNEILNEEKESN